MPRATPANWGRDSLPVALQALPSPRRRQRHQRRELGGPGCVFVAAEERCQRCQSPPRLPRYSFQRIRRSSSTVCAIPIREMALGSIAGGGAGRHHGAAVPAADGAEAMPGAAGREPPPKGRHHHGKGPTARSSGQEAPRSGAEADVPMLTPFSSRFRRPTSGGRTSTRRARPTSRGC